MANKQDVITKEGEVTQALPNTYFEVEVDGETVICHLSGKMRMNRISVMPGDKVRIEVSKYDPSRGRIVYRLK